MKKKGTTESYSALIGIIMAFLMLTAIGCAVYNFYKPKGSEYFDRFTSLLQKLEKERTDQEGEATLYVEPDQVLIGFGKGKEYLGKKGFGAIFDWECYGIRFAWGIYTPFGVTGSIDRPSKCPLGKSCLCLCQMSKFPIRRVEQDACQKGGIKCVIFEDLDFVGGEGCPMGVFVPGMKRTFTKNYERGLRLVYYSKKGNDVSIDDVKPLPISSLEAKIYARQASLSILNMTNKLNTSYMSTQKLCTYSEIELEMLPQNYKVTIDYTSQWVPSPKEYLEFLLYGPEGNRIIIEEQPAEYNRIYLKDKKQETVNETKEPEQEIPIETAAEITEQERPETVSQKELNVTYALPKENVVLLCYTENQSYKKEIKKDGCQKLTITSKGVEFTGDCCEPREWASTKKLYIIKGAEGETQLTTREPKEMQICS